MSEPIPFRPLHLGDVQDDDPEVIASMFEEVSHAPGPDDLPVEPGEMILPSVKPRVPGRLLSGYLLIDPLWVPQQLVPPDVDRVTLHLKVRSPSSSATDFLIVADEPGKLGTATGSGRLYSGDSLSLDGNTSGLYVAPYGTATVGARTDAAGAALSVSWWAATK